MMGGRSWDDWIEEYSHAHEHPVNRWTHTFGIPMIILSIGMVPFCFFFAGLWRWALGLFVIGWILQFVGHYFEGKPPEFFQRLALLVCRNTLVAEKGRRWRLSFTRQS